MTTETQVAGCFYPTALIQPQDVILVENPRAFSVNTFFGALDSIGSGLTSVQIPLGTILSKASEASRFHEGQVVKKYFFLRYGNYINGRDPQSDNAYAHSGGYYILEFSLQGNEARVTKFSVSFN